MTIANFYVALFTGALLGFSLPSVLLGILFFSIHSIFNPVFGGILLLLGTSGCGFLTMLLLWKAQKLPADYY